MSDLYERYTTDDGRPALRTNLHRGQARAYDSEARWVLVLAGTQGGKTSFGPLWLWREMQRCGPGDYIAATATYDLLKLKMLPEMLRFFGEHLQWGTYAAGDKVITSHDGQTRIIIRSAQAEGGLESATAKAAWCDEWGQPTVTIDNQEAIERRLSLSQGRQLITTTPYNLGFLKLRHYDRWVGGDPAYEVIQFRSVDNPAFPVAEYERARELLPAWKFAMFYDGRFSRPAGLIYADYEDSYRESGGHLVKPFTIPAEWLRLVGVDFGPVNEARLWLAEEPGTGDYYAYREAVGGGLSGPEYARQVLEYAEPIKYAMGGSRSEDERRLEWASAGLAVLEPRIYDVEAGIDHVIGLLRQRRLFVFDMLIGLRSELGTYSREVDDAGEPLARIANKEKFHRLDALRYGLSGIHIDRPKRATDRAVQPYSPEWAHNIIARQVEDY